MSTIAMRKFLALACGLLLAGCSGITLIDPPPPVNIYDLWAHGSLSQQAGARISDWQLIVEEPATGRTLDTDRITLKPDAHGVKYFAGARWSDRTPRMLQTHLVSVFEKYGGIDAVGRNSSGLRADYALKSELQAFQAEYFETIDGDALKRKPPIVHMRMSLKVVRQPASRVVSAQVFDIYIPAEADRMSSIVDAFDEAVTRIFTEAIPWALENVERDRLRSS